ncbi:hypothetical protein SLS59_003607 [Nothophoma quercina]|uniref:Nephrocystin 3-like N-terminal domain-containing protein n=1 Tax=Nothophoma quercina TaxID=749835 RepID=A0ABR3RNM3_9PLEO
MNEEQKRNLLDSLRFEQIDARQMTIKTAHAKTCKWLLKSPQYLDWLDASKLCEHHGFLWIKGKAGAGKSTLMKFATINARKTMKGCNVLSFFFNARGDDIEKSTIGTYRSLLLQLLKGIPASQSIFDSLDLSTSTMGANQQWSLERLKALLEQAIRSLEQSPVVCFIDALDECAEEQVREMIRFFEDIGDIAVSKDIRFKVCFSSRHYPHISLRSNGLELVLEGQEGHAQDITNYIETELKIGKSKIAQRVRSELQEKASGVFMWVVLVVGILNKDFDRGQMHALRRRLQEIPGDLHELFHDILTRDSQNTDELVLCIQWVLFARRPLSPGELYHALLSSSDPEAVAEWDPNEITEKDINRFLLNSSKGLTEATVSKESKIQFIHESVRDFLLKENGLSKIWPKFVNNFQGQSHERLKQCCLDYIGTTVACSSKVSQDLSEASSQQAADLRNKATQNHPFLEYAVQNVLYHADTAEGGGISQAEFLHNFSISQWIMFDNLFEKHKVRRHTQRASLLYLVAELNMPNLVRVFNSTNRCTDVENERYGCPLFAAIAMGNGKILELFVESIETQTSDRTSDITVEQLRSQHSLSQCAARRDFIYSRSKTFLANAAELGHDAVLALLIRSAILGVAPIDLKERNLLWWASKNGCEIAARSLLSAFPAMVNRADKDNRTPLHVAAEQGRKKVVELLLKENADINRADKGNKTSLYVAAKQGHKEVVDLLLKGNADIDTQDVQDGNALYIASANGHDEVVTLLLNGGAKIDMQNEGTYSDTLQVASANGHKGVVLSLLNRGANINAEGGRYGNALQAAIAQRQEEIVELLLEKGADVHAQGGYYEKGAGVHAQGGHFGNALQAASWRGHKDIVELLLQKGADVNAQGGEYGNALRAASRYGRNEIVALLKEHGAKANP